MAESSIVIVGAGPAGIRAAEAVVQAGCRPIVIDEEPRDGGQIYRRQPDGFQRSRETLYGTEADRARRHHDTFENLRARIDYRPETIAWNISEGQVHVANGDQIGAIPFTRLIIAAGATDRLMPVSGWNRAGVYSLGGAQIALKSQACSVGRRVAFLGTGPLLYLVSSQYAKAGATVVAVLDTSRFGLRVMAIPKLLSRPDAFLKGIRLTRDLRRAGVQQYHGVTPLEIEGDDFEGVQALSVRLGDGTSKRFECDAVAIGYHLRPETQLADLARCDFEFDSKTRQWFPKTDEAGRSTTDGVYLAGDGCRILGADGAEVAGRLAALAALKDGGHRVADSEIVRLTKLRRALNRFRLGLAEAFPWPYEAAVALPDDTVVCRCEVITVGELRSSCHHKGADEVNRAKAFSRVGMGRCQGRYCGNAAAEILAHARGVPVEQVGRLRGQAPVKPLSVSSKVAAP